MNIEFALPQFYSNTTETEHPIEGPPEKDLIDDKYDIAMPNHCRQKLTILGPVETVNSFVETAHGYPPVFEPQPHEMNSTPQKSVLNFHSLVPLAGYTPGMVYSRNRERGGYEAERDTWGVKWGAYEEQLVIHERGRAEYHFTTAWSVPNRFFYKVSIRFPSLLFLVSYAEESPSRGRLVIQNGGIAKLEDDPEPDFAELVKNKTEDEACEIYQTWEEALYKTHEQWVEDQHFVEAIRDSEKKSAQKS